MSEAEEPPAAAAQRKSSAAAEGAAAAAAAADAPEKPKLVLDRSKTLWDNIASKPAPATEHQEMHLLVLGSKRGGKSTLIQRFIKRDETAIPKPTTALDYSHGRREEGKKSQTAHFWEVGGGSELHMLADVVLTPENIHQTAVVVVVDLSDPRTLWDTLFVSLRRVEARVNECFAKMRLKNNTTPDRLLQRHRRKVGEDHPLGGLPIVICGTKHDLFEDNPHIKVMAKTLRYIAHRHGHHLMWCSSKDEKDMARYRALMANIVFGNAFPEKHMNLDHAVGPLMVWPGRDSFAAIGPPVGLKDEPQGFVPTGDGELDKFKMPFDDAYPPKKTQKEQKDSFTAALYDEFGEGVIDSLRAQKDEEFRKAGAQNAGGKQKRRKSAAADPDEP